MLIDAVLGLVSHDIGIDLGTRRLTVAVRGIGVQIEQASVVVQHKESGQYVAIGEEAQAMLGRTPDSLAVVFPLSDGVVSDYDAAETLLHHCIKQVHSEAGLIRQVPRPRVILSVPSKISEVEERAVSEIARNAGARWARMVQKPIAVAIGAGLSVLESTGRMIVDIGAGTSEIAVISMGGMVVNRSLPLAGNELDEAIQQYIRQQHNLHIGMATAEQIKCKIGTAFGILTPRQLSRTQNSRAKQYTIARGRDVHTGLPRTLKLSSKEIELAIAPSLYTIVTNIVHAIEDTPPELVADIIEQGILLAGGTSRLPGLDIAIAEHSQLPVVSVQEPQRIVALGCVQIFEDPELQQQILREA